MEIDKPILKDKDRFPDEAVLREALKERYPVHESLMEELEKLGITPEWNYYRDGYVWLCKLLFKKKNLAWHAIFEDYFIVTFYFTEKHFEKIDACDISPEIKEAFYKAKRHGKIIPMSVRVDTQLDVLEVIKIMILKKSLK